MNEVERLSAKIERQKQLDALAERLQPGDVLRFVPRGDTRRVTVRILSSEDVRRFGFVFGHRARVVAESGTVVSRGHRHAFVLPLDLDSIELLHSDASAA